MAKTGKKRGGASSGGKGGKGSQTKGATTTSSTKKVNKLEDMVFHVGKSASNFQVVKEFLINHIMVKCGAERARALVSGEDPDWDNHPERPRLQVSTAEDATEAARENQEFAMRFQNSDKRFSAIQTEYRKSLHPSMWHSMGTVQQGNAGQAQERAKAQ